METDDHCTIPSLARKLHHYILTAHDTRILCATPWDAVRQPLDKLGLPPHPSLDNLCKPAYWFLITHVIETPLKDGSPTPWVMRTGIARTAVLERYLNDYDKHYKEYVECHLSRILEHTAPEALNQNLNAFFRPEPEASRENAQRT